MPGEPVLWKHNFEKEQLIKIIDDKFKAFLPGKRWLNVESMTPS